jgi:hypothetical protein
MAIAGTEFSTNTQSADLAFFDTRNASLLHTFTESHGDDITEVRYIYACHKPYTKQLSDTMPSKFTCTIYILLNRWLTQQL